MLNFAIISRAKRERRGQVNQAGLYLVFSSNVSIVINYFLHLRYSLWNDSILIYPLALLSRMRWWGTVVDKRKVCSFITSPFAHRHPLCSYNKHASLYKTPSKYALPPLTTTEFCFSLTYQVNLLQHLHFTCGSRLIILGIFPRSAFDILILNLNYQHLDIRTGLVHFEGNCDTTSLSYPPY